MEKVLPVNSVAKSFESKNALEHKEFQHIHSKQRHFSELKIEIFIQSLFRIFKKILILRNRNYILFRSFKFSSFLRNKKCSFSLLFSFLFCIIAAIVLQNTDLILNSCYNTSHGKYFDKRHNTRAA